MVFDLLGGFGGAANTAILLVGQSWYSFSLPSVAISVFSQAWRFSYICPLPTVRFVSIGFGELIESDLTKIWETRLCIPLQRESSR